MIEVVEKMVSALVIACLLCLSTVKAIGVMQQGGYKTKTFWRWLRSKENLFYNKLSVLALCLALATTVTALCFSFLGVRWALTLSALPCFILLLYFLWSEGKYALKVPAKRTGRYLRLFAVYFLFTAIFTYALIATLGVLSDWNGSKLYALVAYAPVAIAPLLLPVWLILANGFTGIFENARNRRFVKRAGQVLSEREILRVAVVGSYGKTSVKNILKTLLGEKYTVVETPASYNTPMGIAKTVRSEEFNGKEVFIAEMGARRKGDIRELCDLVHPDYALFTGVCEQHILTFGSIENVLKEKSEVLRHGAKIVVCGEGLRGRVERSDGVLFAGENNIQNLQISTEKTTFTLLVGGEKLAVETPLLGRSAAENIAMAATLAYEMGLTAAELSAGIAKLQPTPHRLARMENGGVVILDDGYNGNIKGAAVALEVLQSATGRRCVVTPGLVEGGILEEALNERLGELIAQSGVEKVILVGETLVGAVKTGYMRSGDEERLTVVKTLQAAQEALAEWVQSGDTVLFLNDLPDIY